MSGARDVIHTPDYDRGPDTLLLLHEGDVSTNVSLKGIVTRVVSVAFVVQLSPRLDILEQLALCTGTVKGGECFHGCSEPFVEAEEFGQNILVKVEVA